MLKARRGQRRNPCRWGPRRMVPAGHQSPAVSQKKLRQKAQLPEGLPHPCLLSTGQDLAPKGNPLLSQGRLWVSQWELVKE